jgi:hypothetical protein
MQLHGTTFARLPPRATAHNMKQNATAGSGSMCWSEHFSIAYLQIIGRHSGVLFVRAVNKHDIILLTVADSFVWTQSGLNAPTCQGPNDDVPKFGDNNLKPPRSS